MKRLISAALILLGIAGCTTVPAPETRKAADPAPGPVQSAEPARTAEAQAAPVVDAKPEAIAVAAAAGPEERKPAQRIVAKKVYLLIRETTSYPDGSVSDVTTYSYDGDSLLPMRKETRDSHRILLETAEYEYEDGRPVRVTVKDGGGRLKSRRVSTYTPEGLLESETLSGKDGRTASVSRYQYDDAGNRIRWSVFDGAQVLLGVTDYVFQEGRNVRMDIRNAAGKPERSVLLEYGDGRRTRDVYRLPTGETDKSTLYSWKDGRLASESAFGPADRPVSRMEYSYDGNGNMVAARTFDRTGAPTQTRNREYEERTITHVVPE